VCDLFLRQPTEETQLDHAALALVEQRQFLQRYVEVEQIDLHRERQAVALQGDALAPAAALERAHRARPVDQHVTQGARSQRDELRAGQALEGLGPREPQIAVVDEVRRRDRAPGLAPLERPAGYFPQSRIERCDKLVERSLRAGTGAQRSPSGAVMPPYGRKNAK